ncbi:hypothetical protein PspLS_09855 [Pyricularia sp. CBS 133598]|nr:hypothetical protein PspLS_09855 [Pyricularia sp. CBS 133598]
MESEHIGVMGPTHDAKSKPRPQKRAAKDAETLDAALSRAKDIVITEDLALPKAKLISIAETDPAIIGALSKCRRSLPRQVTHGRIPGSSIPQSFVTIFPLIMHFYSAIGSWHITKDSSSSNSMILQTRYIGVYILNERNSRTLQSTVFNIILHFERKPLHT